MEEVKFILKDKFSREIELGSKSFWEEAVCSS